MLFWLNNKLLLKEPISDLIMLGHRCCCGFCETDRFVLSYAETEMSRRPSNPQFYQWNTTITEHLLVARVDIPNSPLCGGIQTSRASGLAVFDLCQDFNFNLILYDVSLRRSGSQLCEYDPDGLGSFFKIDHIEIYDGGTLLYKYYTLTEDELSNTDPADCLNTTTERLNGEIAYINGGWEIVTLPHSITLPPGSNYHIRLSYSNDLANSNADSVYSDFYFQVIFKKEIV